MPRDAKQLSPPTMDTLKEGVWKENPVFIALLGLCPALAVSNTALNALAMGLASTVVLLGSTTLISVLRHLIPKQVRIASYIIIIATFVTIVDYTIHALSLELYNALGAFIQLIVVNCMILGRAEAYASKNRVITTIINSIGMGAGFTLALFLVGAIREILGFGTFFGIPLFGPDFQPWAVFILPPGGFIVLSLWLVLFAAIRRRKEQRKEVAHVA